MNETLVTVVGNVATKPVFREATNGSVVRFRLAVTARFYDRTAQQWKDGHTNFFTVWAWRALAVNAASSVSVGDPLIVQGRLKVRDEDRGGRHWMSADIEAWTMGHDMSRGNSAFRRGSRAHQDAVTQSQGSAVSNKLLESPGGPAPATVEPTEPTEPSQRTEVAEFGAEVAEVARTGEGSGVRERSEPQFERDPDQTLEPAPAF